VPEQTELERDLRQLEVSLRKLETEYNMYFAGTLPRPPVEARARVEKLFRRYDRAYIQSYADRFRLGTLQARFSKFTDLWDRAQRAREEGRPGPFARAPRTEPAPSRPVPAAEAAAPATPAAAATPAASGPARAATGATPAARPHAGDRVLCVATVADPAVDKEKIRELYESLVEARRATGNDEALPFQRFAQMVKTQVAKLRESGSGEVAFRVSVKDNKVAFTAKGVKASE
jgi:hypothetical protein